MNQQIRLKIAGYDPFQICELRKISENAAKFLLKKWENENDCGWESENLPNNWIELMSANMEYVCQPVTADMLGVFEAQDEYFIPGPAVGVICKFCPDDPACEQRFQKSWQRERNWNRLPLSQHLLKCHEEVWRVLKEFNSSSKYIFKNEIHIEFVICLCGIRGNFSGWREFVKAMYNLWNIRPHDDSEEYDPKRMFEKSGERTTVFEPATTTMKRIFTWRAVACDNNADIVCLFIFIF